MLVTEPTPFGLHDLKIAVQLVRKMGLPFGVVLNKASDSSRLIHEFCESEEIELLNGNTFSQDIAKGFQEGFFLFKLMIYGKKNLKELL